MSDFFEGWDDGETLDLGPDLIETDRYDANGPLSLLNQLTYNISVVHDLDGLYDELLTTPEMASEKPGGILWVLMTSGFFHRVRLSATVSGQYYHVRLCEATMAYQGQLS